MRLHESRLRLQPEPTVSGSLSLHCPQGHVLDLAVEPAELRRGIDGLSAIVQQRLGHRGGVYFLQSRR